jgi:N-acetyl sugar amidotransferase
MSLFRCTRCLYPSSKPDIHFDDDGLCSACQAFDKRKEIDWSTKARDFMELVELNRGSSHDLIVACSGGKDSTYQIVKCLELGLRPLAVTATTDHLSELGRKNLDNISNLCDHIEVTPHKPTRRKIARFALEEVGDISWCEHHLIWSVPAREAVARNIPIVLYGEAPQNEYGAGPAGSEKIDRLTPEWIHEFGGLLGLRLSDMTEILGIDPRHLEIYRYPQNAENVQAVFMGAYFEWDGYRNYGVAHAHGFMPHTSHVEGSLYNYENLDNLQTGIHDYLRFLKFGYGRCVDIASNHIRRSKMPREIARVHAELSDGKYPASYLGVPLEDILAPLDLTVRDFDKICDRFTNREVVEWASKPESFQCFSGTNTAPSKENSLAKTAA